MFYYYGGKARSAGRYPAPQRRLIIEPFAGAAGYSMYHICKDRRLECLLVEKDERVVAVWKMLLGMSAEEMLNYPVPEIGETTDDMFLMTSTASNGVAATNIMTVTRRLVRNIGFMKRRVAKILGAGVGARIEVVHGEYYSAPDEDATWFIDPPYTSPLREKSPRAGGNGYAFGCRAADLDFEKLGRWCRTRRGQAMVCEYADATWLPFRRLYGTANGLGKRYSEGIWTNAPRTLNVPPWSKTHAQGTGTEENG